MLATHLSFLDIYAFQRSANIFATNKQDLCSDITQDVLVEDAARKRGSARRQLDEGPSDEVERTVRFYNRFIKKMQKVPRYLTCDSVDVPQISRLNDIFRRAIVAQQLDA